METLVKSEAFMRLYNQTFTITPELTPVISEVAQSLATSPEPVSTSGGKNGKMVNTILITAGLCLLIYGGYRWHIYFQAKKVKQV
jgi:hypothetical protein